MPHAWSPSPLKLNYSATQSKHAIYLYSDQIMLPFIMNHGKDSAEVLYCGLIDNRKDFLGFCLSASHSHRLFAASTFLVFQNAPASLPNHSWARSYRCRFLERPRLGSLKLIDHFASLRSKVNSCMSVSGHQSPNENYITSHHIKPIRI